MNGIVVLHCTSKRIIDPNKAKKFAERLHAIQQQKVDDTETALLKATTVSEVKKAFQAKASLRRYGTYIWLSTVTR